MRLEGMAMHVHRRMVVYTEESPKASAMVVMPVAQYGHIHIVKTYTQCLGIP
jgi:hypothetical protein